MTTSVKRMRACPRKALRRRVSYSGYYASLPRTKYGFDSRYPLKRKQKRIHSGPLLLFMGNGSRTCHDRSRATWQAEVIRQLAENVDECDWTGSIQRCPGQRALLARGRNSHYFWNKKPWLRRNPEGMGEEDTRSSIKIQKTLLDRRLLILAIESRCNNLL